MSEPKLTAPQRRYEIIDDSNEVIESLGVAFIKGAPAFFDIKLADVYDGELPIPDNILQRNLGMIVLSLICNRQTGEVRATGSTVENSAETVRVDVPKDRDKRSILYLLDIGSSEKDQ